jgi:hypothetical protein
MSQGAWLFPTEDGQRRQQRDNIRAKKMLPRFEGGRFGVGNDPVMRRTHATKAKEAGGLPSATSRTRLADTVTEKMKRETGFEPATSSLGKRY